MEFKDINKKREYYEKNKDKIIKRNQNYYQKNIDKKREYAVEYGKKYREKKKDKVIKTRKEHYRKNKEKYQKYRDSHKEEMMKYNKKYYKNNMKEIKKQTLEYEKQRMKTDKNFNVQKRLRGLFLNVFRVYTKTGKIMSSRKYGIDYKAIIEHLKPFPKDISKYHIDHIKPICSFTYINEDGSTNLKEVQKAFAPENHQWLTAEENFRKGGKY